MRRLVALLFTALLLAGPAAAGSNTVVKVATDRTVATGTPVTVTATNQYAKQAYLFIVTSGEVATASMVAVVGDNVTGTSLGQCTLPAITTNTTTEALLGSAATAAAPIEYVCPFPIGRDITVVFTTSGAGASFVVNAWLEFLAE